jgi:hypothetical protein
MDGEHDRRLSNHLKAFMYNGQVQLDKHFEALTCGLNNENRQAAAEKHLHRLTGNQCECCPPTVTQTNGAGV